MAGDLGSRGLLLEAPPSKGTAAIRQTVMFLDNELENGLGEVLLFVVRENAKSQKQELESRMFVAEHQGRCGKSAPRREMSWRPRQSELPRGSLSREGLG